MPAAAKFTGCSAEVAKVLIGDCLAMTKTRGSAAALPIHDIFARSNFTPRAR